MDHSEAKVLAALVKTAMEKIRVIVCDTSYLHDVSDPRKPKIRLSGYYPGRAAVLIVSLSERKKCLEMSFCIIEQTAVNPIPETDLKQYLAAAQIPGISPSARFNGNSENGFTSSPDAIFQAEYLMSFPKGDANVEKNINWLEFALRHNARRTASRFQTETDIKNTFGYLADVRSLEYLVLRDKYDYMASDVMCAQVLAQFPPGLFSSKQKAEINLLMRFSKAVC